MKLLRRQTDIMCMSRVGYIRDQKYEVYVNTNDGESIPHFHLRDAKDWNKFHTCIKIESAEYFNHGEKTDTLNHKLKADLQKFMESDVTISKYKGKFYNNWELVCFLWDMNNSDVMIKDDTIQPDYRSLG